MLLTEHSAPHKLPRAAFHNDYNDCCSGLLVSNINFIFLHTVQSITHTIITHIMNSILLVGYRIVLHYRMVSSIYFVSSCFLIQLLIAYRKKMK